MFTVPGALKVAGVPKKPCQAHTPDTLPNTPAAAKSTSVPREDQQDVPPSSGEMEAAAAESVPSTSQLVASSVDDIDFEDDDEVVKAALEKEELKALKQRANAAGFDTYSMAEVLFSPTSLIISLAHLSQFSHFAPISLSPSQAAASQDTKAALISMLMLKLGELAYHGNTAGVKRQLDMEKDPNLEREFYDGWAPLTW